MQPIDAATAAHRAGHVVALRVLGFPGVHVRPLVAGAACIDLMVTEVRAVDAATCLCAGHAAELGWRELYPAPGSADVNSTGDLYDAQLLTVQYDLHPDGPLEAARSLIYLHWVAVESEIRETGEPR